jgi:hypothetical protein
MWNNPDYLLRVQARLRAGSERSAFNHGHFGIDQAISPTTPANNGREAKVPTAWSVK